MSSFPKFSRVRDYQFWFTVSLILGLFLLLLSFALPVLATIPVWYAWTHWINPQDLYAPSAFGPRIPRGIPTFLLFGMYYMLVGFASYQAQKWSMKLNGLCRELNYHRKYLSPSAVPSLDITAEDVAEMVDKASTLRT
jgi:hypothetical protein